MEYPCIRALLLATITTVAAASLPARGEEPLLLRIRPNDPPPPSAVEPDAAAAASARREAVWARSQARARVAIASVCTGCLKPTPPEPAPRRRDPVGPAPDAVDVLAPSIDPNPPAALFATAGEP